MTKVPDARQRMTALLAAILTTLSCLAYNITGLVVDPEGEILPQASVRLLTAKDSSFVGGVMTGANGRFNLTGIKNGKYTVEVTYIGYQTLNHDVTVNGANVKIDTLRMSEGAIALGEVRVTGVRTPIKVMEDTVEYDAGAYRTQPNAVVEDLLKRLPGVEIGDDGSITANGKTVSKILLDGEEFFGSDPQVASKNLPVEMIQKLQVVDRKSDLARMTGVDDGEEETVINLTVKPGMKNGWFGVVQGGYGTDDRYKGGFNVNRLWGNNQSITFLGNFNNINERGFTDSNGSNFQGWGPGRGGITTTQSFGVNFNVGNQQIFRVGGNLIYSHTDASNITSSERQYLFPDSSSYVSSATSRRNKGHNINGDFRMVWKPDSFNTLEVRPNLSLSYTDSWTTDSSLTRDGYFANVNRSMKNSSSDGNRYSFGMRVIYNHNFRQRRGRSFSVMANYSHSNTQEDRNFYNEAYFWRRLPYILSDSIDLDDQIYDYHTWNNSFSARLTWTEPIGNVARGNFLTFGYRISYNWQNADKLVYEHPVFWPDGFEGLPVIDYSQTILSDTLSNVFRNTNATHEFSFGYRKVSAKYNLNVGFNIYPQMRENRDLVIEERSIPRKWAWNYAPFLRYRHRFTRTMNLQANYNGRSSQPSLTQLQPVPDTSDPLNVVVGNPDLSPTFTHRLNLRFNDFSSMAQRSFMVMLDASLAQNTVANRISYDPATGGRTTTYENVNGNWSTFMMGMFSQPLRNKNWSVSVMADVNLNHSVGFNNGDKNRSLSQRYSIRPGITFRPENLEFELRPSYSYQASHNSLPGIQTNNVHNYGGMFRAYWYIPFGLTLSSDVRYTATRGYAAGYDKNEWMWNASISYQTLRDKSLTLTLSGHDLLHQQTSISRSITANYIDDSRVNNLTRYFMFTVAWRFNTVGKGARAAGFGDEGGWGGPGGPGGPGGRPGGPGRR